MKSSTMRAIANETGGGRSLRESKACDISTPTTTVMQLVLSLSPGGTERLVTELVRRLPPGFRSVVCCLDKPGVWGEELRQGGTTVIGLERQEGFRPGLARKIAAVASQQAVDVIHCHHYSPYVYGQLAARLMPGVRLVFTEHGRLSDGAPSLRRRLANQVFARLPADVYAVSEDLRGHLVAEGFSPRRVRVIPNGIEVCSPPSSEMRTQMKSALGFGQETFVVGTVGRLDPVKDLGVLLQGFARFHAESGRSGVVVVGDGMEREPLTQLAASLGLSGSVKFLGHREDVGDLLQGFDVYAGTSIFEGISLTILEAMAAELPVVATAVGGTPEIVLDDETGRLISPRNSEALADALRFLFESPAVASAWGRAGRKRVLERFTIEGMVRKYARVYTGKES